MSMFCVSITKWLAQDTMTAETWKKSQDIPEKKEEGGGGETVAKKGGCAPYDFIQVVSDKETCE